jgi:hypothetical protein
MLFQPSSPAHRLPTSRHDRLKSKEDHAISRERSEVAWYQDRGQSINQSPTPTSDRVPTTDLNRVGVIPAQNTRYPSVRTASLAAPSNVCRVGIRPYESGWTDWIRVLSTSNGKVACHTINVIVITVQIHQSVLTFHRPIRPNRRSDTHTPANHPRHSSSQHEFTPTKFPQLVLRLLRQTRMRMRVRMRVCIALSHGRHRRCRSMGGGDIGGIDRIGMSRSVRMRINQMSQMG